ALKSRRADSPGPSLPERSKNPTPCLYSTTCLTPNSAGHARLALRSKATPEPKFIVSPLRECLRAQFPFGACSTRLRFLKEFVESAARVVGVAGGWGAGVHRRGRGRRGLAGGAFAGHRYTRSEERAFVGFVLQRNAHRDGLETLETGGGLEVRALFAAVQI